MRGSPAGTDAGGTRHGRRLGARSEHSPTSPATALSVGLKDATVLSRTQKHRKVRPIHHHLEDRVRAHLLICMLAYYLTWHLRHAWTELLFDDPYPAATIDPVAKANRSTAAERKAQTKRTPDDQPCHSLESLLDELATRSRNTIKPAGTDATFDQHTEPTQLQARALALINEQTPNIT